MISCSVWYICCAELVFCGKHQAKAICPRLEKVKTESFFVSTVYAF